MHACRKADEMVGEKAENMNAKSGQGHART